MMRREQIKHIPADPAPIRLLRDYPPEQRSALMRAVGAAIKSGAADRDADFASWCERRSVDVD